MNLGLAVPVPVRTYRPSRADNGPVVRLYLAEWTGAKFSVVFGLDTLFSCLMRWRHSEASRHYIGGGKRLIDYLLQSWAPNLSRPRPCKSTYCQKSDVSRKIQSKLFREGHLLVAMSAITF